MNSKILRLPKKWNSLSSVPMLDVTTALDVPRFEGDWFRLGTYTREKQKHFLGASEAVVRQSFLMRQGEFKENFDHFDESRRCLDGLGKPTWFVQGKKKELIYLPYNLFKFPWTDCYAEPVVFALKEKGLMDLFINPDIALLFELEKRRDDLNSWFDPRSGKEVLRKELIENGNEVAVEICRRLLMRYLTLRQMSLVVGHFWSLEIIDPSESVVQKVKTGKTILGSTAECSKALIDSYSISKGIRQDFGFARRWLNLWFEIEPARADINDPRSEEPSFDIFSLTLPTRSGDIAPGRFADFKNKEKRRFKGH